jgi:hypothetical protein
MDLVTVTYSGDLPAMRLQSHSLDRFITEPITHHVYIEDAALALPTWHQQLVPFYSRHRLMLGVGGSNPPDRTILLTWSVDHAIYYCIGM